jgi:type IV secretory pathway TraG/TraD family ATPase VirD4
MGLRSFFAGKPDGLHLGIGYSINDYRKEKLLDIWQLNKNRKGHTFVAGATRVGKTRLLQNMIMQDIRAGHSVGLIDPKGDWEIWEAIVQEAYRTGREKELIFISPIYPEYSVPINPLTNFIIEEEPINHIVAGVPSDDEFFYNVALETTTVIVKTLLLQKRREDTPTGELNIDEVCELASFEGIMKCKEIVKPLLEMDNDAKRVQTLIDQVLGSGYEYFSKVSTTLRTTVTQMTVGQTGKIMGSARGNKLIDRLEKQERVIFYAQTGAMLTSEVSKIMARVLVSMLQSLAGRLFAKGKALQTPLCLYMDEFSNMVYRGVENFFNKGGGANCYLTAATQSLADVEAAIGGERARMVFDNTNTKIFMRVNDLKTAQTLAAYGGVKRVYSYILGSSGSITTRESEDDVIKPAEFLNLEPREFHYFGFEGRFIGKSAPIEPVELKIAIDGINGIDAADEIDPDGGDASKVGAIP